MNMENLMKQAQAFQEKLNKAQAELADKTVTATVGGGMVTVVMNGRQEVIKVHIEPAVINPEDPVMLQDLLVAAVNEAHRQAEDLARTAMAGLTGGLSIPGLF
ncbi:MAG: YbaB/EbfC family nucleoid-associated protein [Deltaproteobacteria bacterium]